MRKLPCLGILANPAPSTVTLPVPQGDGPGNALQMERWDLILLAFNQSRIMCLISLRCKQKGEIHELLGGVGV